ncbi:MAG: phytanoyl-CoA dioxygenase family protein [Candidatus Latescibacterota bacterium]|nr:phytanoyl-CoA dioxygenase family protein [Candidatus Latescibacterota bacterium]
MPDTSLTTEQKQKYDRDGWVVLPSLFTADECDGLIQHMDAVHAGHIAIERFVPPAEGADHLIDADQCHIHDPVCRDFMLHPKLRAPLRDALDGDEPEGIKSHYWWKGSQWSQGWHCDGTALPECIGVWIALVDVDETIGTLAMQTGGHQRRILHHDDLRPGKWAGHRTHSGDPELRARLREEIFGENEAAGLEQVHIVAKKGTAVIFDGYLWHRGVMGSDPGAFRQVYACHYIPASFTQWPHVLWERIDFDGIKRWSTGDEQTPAARHNARLPRHPAMEFSASSKDPSLLPTRKDAPLQILSVDQAQDMDLRGFTVIEDVFSATEIGKLRDQIDRLGPGSVTVKPSAVARSFCGGSFFQKVCHDVLNCDGVRLFDHRVECREPGVDAGTAFHQDIAQVFVEPLQYLTCWIALDDADEISGCPWFVPELFRRGPLRHEVDESTGDVAINDLRSDDAVCVQLQKGSVALYWSLTPHRIGANDTNKPGLAYIYQYAPDGYDDRIWDNTANSGQGGPMAADAARPVVDETRNFMVLPGLERQ